MGDVPLRSSNFAFERKNSLTKKSKQMNTSFFKSLAALLLISFSILLINCSEEPAATDPCENRVCDNGFCDEGICQCEDGWMGAACDKVDFSGEWRMTQYTTIDCSQYFFTDIKGDGSERQLCGKAEEFDICYETFIILKDDGTFDRQDALFLHNEDGTVETIFNEAETGTWVVEGNESLLRTRTTDVPGSRLYTVKNDKTTMFRLHDQADGGPNCTLDVEFRKAQ